MKPAERLTELMALQGRAEKLSEKVGVRLNGGQSPEQLVPLLQDQVETLKRFQHHLATFVEEGSSDSRTAFKTELQKLKHTFQKLLQTSETHTQESTRKGIRLTGIGGKPYTSPPGQATS